MSSSQVVVGIGLGLDVLATLFLSLDALKGQGQFGKLLEVQSYTIELDRILRQQGPAGLALPQGNWIDEALKIAQDGGEAAQQRNYKLVTDRMNEISGDLRKRKGLIAAAIAAVFVGGVLEFIGGVLLG